AWSEVRSFNSANPPSIPALSLPAADALTTDYSPTLKWTTVTVPSGTTFGHYWVQVDDDQLFDSPELDDQISLTTAASTQIDVPTLLPNKKYYWRVMAINSLGETSAWSTVRTFRTAFTPPVLTSPANGSAVTTLKPALDWDDVTSATGYTVQISTSSTFATTLVNATITPSTYTSTVYLPSGNVVYWRVRANGANGPSAWSEVKSFTTP
ncbi:MAG TPA: hypothetical protein VKP08_04070, partial [Anaerolineales bacterium]|nr:hypothetical protein [Anaerolineales bacterium]